MVSFKFTASDSVKVASTPPTALITSTKASKFTSAYPFILIPKFFAMVSYRSLIPPREYAAFSLRLPWPGISTYISLIRDVTFNFLCFISSVAIIIESERLAAPPAFCSSRFLSAPTKRIFTISESLRVSYLDTSTVSKEFFVSKFKRLREPLTRYCAVAAILPTAMLIRIPITRNTFPTIRFFPDLFFFAILSSVSCLPPASHISGTASPQVLSDQQEQRCISHKTTFTKTKTYHIYPSTDRTCLCHSGKMFCNLSFSPGKPVSKHLVKSPSL